LKPLSAKLGVWPNDRLLVVNPDPRVIERLRNENRGSVNFFTEAPAPMKIPMVLVWLREGDDATALANSYKHFIDNTGQIWFFFPKKETMRKNQLTLTREAVQQDVSRANLEMTKICSIDADTQAMGFVLPLG
jgi:hypothetical protein